MKKRQIIAPMFLLLLLLAVSCQTKKQLVLDPKLADFPPVIIWAWERPEDLEFLDTKKFGVAFLAQTLELKGDEVIFRPRRQPLKVSTETKLIAVTRIESPANQTQKPALSDAQNDELLRLVLKTLVLKNVSAVQIDFDAKVSERDFYRKFLNNLSAKLPEKMPLSITALASFCLSDDWIKDLPVDEAIPMIFRMGADEKVLKSSLANGDDFRVPLCQQSYGIATDEPLKMTFDRSRRIYVFKGNDTPEKSWSKNDVEKLEILFQ